MLEIIEYHLLCACVSVSLEIGGPQNCKNHRLRFLWVVDSKP